MQSKRARRANEPNRLTRAPLPPPPAYRSAKPPPVLLCPRFSARCNFISRSRASGIRDAGSIVIRADAPILLLITGEIADEKRSLRRNGRRCGERRFRSLEKYKNINKRDVDEGKIDSERLFRGINSSRPLRCRRHFLEIK